MPAVSPPPTVTNYSACLFQRARAHIMLDPLCSPHPDARGVRNARAAWRCSAPAIMGIHTAPWGQPDCVCCPPGARKGSVSRSVPPSLPARHAFLLAVRQRKLPRDVLQRILQLAVVVEVHVVAPTRHVPFAATRRAISHPRCGPDELSMASLCLDADDAPP